MINTPYTIDAFDAAREQVEAQLKAVKERLNAPDLDVEVGTTPAEGAFRSLQMLREHDRNEVKFDSLRQFHLYLSLVHAAVTSPTPRLEEDHPGFSGVMLDI